MKHMRTVSIDYSEADYRDLAGTDVPEQYAGKFVQIRKGVTEYLVFSSKVFARFHADIVERFCMDRGIPGIYNGQNKSFEVLDPSWVVRGGGRFERDRKRKLLHLYDNSMAYGKFEKKGLKEKVLSLAGFSDYTVRID